jgi:Tol biopolymer transport system component
VGEALEIARHICEGLEAAHEKGIIHRDLKPANIKLTPGGKVKVLDFGLAKAFEEQQSTSLSNSPTLVSEPVPGVILGTAAYMSPEQARGQVADRTSDVWSFGCVLFEMITGRQAFAGTTLSDTLAAILKVEPDWNLLPRSLPSPARRLLRRCLEKQRSRRLHDMTDVRIEIEDAVTEPAAPVGTNAHLDATSRKRQRTIWMSLSGLIAVSALLAVVYWPRGPGAAEVIRFQIYPPQHATLYSGAVPTISPDGRRLAFIAVSGSKRQIWIQALDSLDAQPLQGTDDAESLFWSPDNRSIGFFASPAQLKRVEVSGGAVRTLCEVPSTWNWQGGTWNRDGVVLFSMDGDFYTVSSEGGTPKKLSLPTRTIDGYSRRGWPHFLPNSRQFVFVGELPEAGFQKAGIYLGSLESGAVKLLDGETLASAVVDSSGHLLYVRQGVLVAAPFDLRRQMVAGDAVPLAENAGFNAGIGFSSAMSASDNGLLTYWGGYGRSTRQLTWFDRAGRRLGELTAPGDYIDVELSPDASRAGAEILDPKVGTADMWLVGATQRISSRFTFDQSWDFGLHWSSDSAATIYTSARAGDGNIARPDGHTEIRRRSITGGSEEILLQEPAVLLSTDWSLDGRLILYEKRDSKTGWDIWVLPVGGDRKPYPFLNSAADEGMARFSPNGKWIAYASTETGRPEIFVRNFPDKGAKWQISTAGGSGPRWRRDGRELFYVGGDGKLMAVSINSNPAFSYGAPQALDVKAEPSAPGWGRFGYDVTPDGQKFVVNTVVENPAPIPITVVVNWTAALYKK